MNSGTRKLMSLWRPNNDSKQKENNNKEMKPSVEHPAPTKSHKKQHGSNPDQEVTMKRNKLLSSKSLCQLIPESLSIRRPGDPRKRSNGCLRSKKECYLSSTNNSRINDRLGTTKSFPSASCQFQVQSHRFHISGISTISPIVHPDSSKSSKSRQNIQTNDLPISSSIAHEFINESFESDEVEKKLASRAADEKEADMSWAEIGPPVDNGEQSDNLRGQNTSDEICKSQTSASSGSQSNQDAATKKQGHMTRTALVLRDVKNSLGLRIKAKHESKAFKKFTNEVDTPPTKLYSPFNIYSEEDQDEFQDISLDCEWPDCRPRRSPRAQKANPIGGPNGNENNDEPNGRLKARARLAIFGKRERQLSDDNGILDHDTPNKRLRAMVKDVEQSQQCIEDISRSIEGRKMLMH